MLGRYFARFDESPTEKVLIKGQYMKRVSGAKARREPETAARYEGDGQLSFVEGVDSYVPYAGKLRDNVQLTSANPLDDVQLRILDDRRSSEERPAHPRLGDQHRGRGAHDVVLKESDEYHR